MKKSITSLFLILFASIAFSLEFLVETGNFDKTCGWIGDNQLLNCEKK
jgi:hypothetical protein